MQQYYKTSTAETWDSFKRPLQIVLKLLQPETAFEYGPGVSTDIISTYPSIISVESVEHDKVWYNKNSEKGNKKTTLYYQPDLSLYAETIDCGQHEKYDIIFIDGVVRQKCLFLSKDKVSDHGVVMLHDAERFEYKDAINFYKHKFFTDKGNTVVLTDNDIISYKLESVL